MIQIWLTFSCLTISLPFRQNPTISLLPSKLCLRGECSLLHLLGPQAGTLQMSDLNLRDLLNDVTLASCCLEYSELGVEKKGNLAAIENDL